MLGVGHVFLPALLPVEVNHPTRLQHYSANHTIIRVAEYEELSIRQTVLFNLLFPAEDLYCQHMTQVHLPGVHGRVEGWYFCEMQRTIPRPWAMATGSGMMAAVIGTYVLAVEMAKACRETKQLPTTTSIQEAAQKYERVMKPFIMGKLSSTFWLTELLLPRTRFDI